MRVVEHQAPSNQLNPMYFLIEGAEAGIGAGWTGTILVIKDGRSLIMCKALSEDSKANE